MKQKTKIPIGGPQIKNDQSYQSVDFNIQKKCAQGNSQSMSRHSQQQPTQNINTQQPQKPNQNIVNTYHSFIKPRRKEICLFTDSMPKGVNMRNSNSSLGGGRADLKAFPGVKSTQHNHQLRPTLDEFQYDATKFMSESMTFYDERVKRA